MSLPQILQHLNNQTSPSMQPDMLAGIKNTISVVKSIGSPEKVMEMLLQNQNPALAKAMDYIKQNGGDAESACKKLLQENGIDPAEVMKLIK